MFRIVKFQFPYKSFVDFAMSKSWGAEAIQEKTDLATVTAGGEKVFETQPMSTTSSLFFEVEQCARSLYGDPPHLIVDMTADYKLLRTRAPADYDYSYVIEIGKMPGEFGEERLVVVPKDRVEYQSGRYSSGMYTPIVCS